MNLDKFFEPENQEVTQNVQVNKPGPSGKNGKRIAAIVVAAVMVVSLAVTSVFAVKSVKADPFGGRGGDMPNERMMPDGDMKAPGDRNGEMPPEGDFDKKGSDKKDSDKVSKDSDQSTATDSEKETKDADKSTATDSEKETKDADKTADNASENATKDTDKSTDNDSENAAKNNDNPSDNDKSANNNGEFRSMSKGGMNRAPLFFVLYAVEGFGLGLSLMYIFMSLNKKDSENPGEGYRLSQRFDNTENGDDLSQKLNNLDKEGSFSQRFDNPEGNDDISQKMDNLD